MKPTKADRKKFDLDLKYGQKYEDEFSNIVVNSKLKLRPKEECGWTQAT